LRHAGAPGASDFLRKPDEGAWAYAQRIFDLVYVSDIERVVKIDALWDARSPPTPLPCAADILQADAAAPPADAPADGLLQWLKLNPRQVWLHCLNPEFITDPVCKYSNRFMLPCHQAAGQIRWWLQ
jgi:hypothetical protein